MSWSRSRRSERRVVRPRRLGVFVAVDGLAKEGDLLHALADERPGLVDDHARRAALLRTPHGGDDAVRAELVTAHHDPDERLMRVRPHGGLAERVIFRETRSDGVARPGRPCQAHRELRLALGLRPVEEFRHLAELSRADDHVDERRPLEDRRLILLGHAPEHADRDLGLRLLEPSDAAEGAVDLVLGVLADGAGVVEDRVGLVDVVGEGVSLAAQLGDDELAVQDVHLTADGLDVELLPGRRLRHRRKLLVRYRRRGKGMGVGSAWRLSAIRS